MTTTSTPTTTTSARAVGWAAAAGALVSAVSGAFQVIRTKDENPLIDGGEHTVLTLLVVFLALWAPAYLLIGRRSGTLGRIGSYLAVAGMALLAFGATASNLHNEDYAWFPAVAVPANLFWLAGSVMLTIATVRSRSLPRALAYALPLVFVCSIFAAQIGGGLIAAVIWAGVAWHLINGGAGDERPAAPATH